VAAVSTESGQTPRFGALYALESMEEATRFRLENERLSQDVDPDLIEELGAMFAEENMYAKKFKHMKDVMEGLVQFNVLLVQDQKELQSLCKATRCRERVVAYYYAGKGPRLGFIDPSKRSEPKSFGGP
jgi:hypothetical protein